MIKLIKSTFYRESETKKKLVGFITEAKQLSMGKECSKFEKAFAKKQDRKYAVLVNSGSSANLILIQALLNLGLLKKGDRIGFSILTWATNVMPLIQLGLVPVAIDCELNTLNVSPRTLKNHLGEIRGLFLTNVLGFSDRIDKIKSICEENEIIFFEDNCESLGSRTDGKLLGNFGLASTFSFYVGHHLSTIEGGMVCTDDEKLYEMLVMVRAHGWDRNLPTQTQNKLQNKYRICDFFKKYTFYDLAYNVRPTEISGFLGNCQMSYWDTIISEREKNFRMFQQQIDNNHDFIPLKLDFMDVISNFAMPLVCKSRELCKKYKERFIKNDIEIRPIIAGDITKQPFYRKYVNAIPRHQNASLIHQNGFYFPNNPELTKDDLNILTNLLKK